MHRRSLIKCILGLAAAPKILAELDFEPPVVANTGLTRSLIGDLQLLTPQYYKSFIDKYGSVDYSWWLSEMGKAKKHSGNEYFWFESNNKTKKECGI